MIYVRKFWVIEGIYQYVRLCTVKLTKKKSFSLQAIKIHYGINSFFSNLSTTLVYIYIYIYKYIYIFTSPSARARYDTRSIFFKWSLTGLNSEFSFS